MPKLMCVRPAIVKEKGSIGWFDNGEAAIRTRLKFIVMVSLSNTLQILVAHLKKKKKSWPSQFQSSGKLIKLAGGIGWV